MGGWVQLKFKPDGKVLKLNGAFGQDNPFAHRTPALHRDQRVLLWAVALEKSESVRQRHLHGTVERAFLL